MKIKKTLSKNNVINNHNSYKIGDVKANKCPNYSQHPVVIVGDSETVYPVVGLTHSPTTNGKDNIVIREGIYIRPHIDLINKKYINDGYVNDLSKNEIAKILSEASNKINIHQQLKDYKLLK